MDDLEKAVVLVVDDVHENIDLLSDLLSPVYRVKAATSGEMALQVVRNSSTIDLILLDVMMPGMDGYAVCSQLKQDERYKDVPVIFISALNELEDRVKGFAAGGVDFIIKPIQPEEVLARAKTHVQNSQMQRQLKKAHDLLERRVMERTQELEEANETLREMYKHMAHSEKQYRDLLEASPDGVLLVGESGEIKLANSAASDLFGYPLEEMRGLLIEKLVPPRFESHLNHRKRYMGMPAHTAVGKSGLSCSGARSSLVGLRQDGSEFPVDITLSPMSTDEGKMVIADVRDLSDRILLEEQLSQAQKMEALGQLTGGIAHDFNNILAIIIAYTELIQGLDVQDDRVARYLDEILTASDRARNLIAQMLLFSRFDSKKELEPLDIGGLIQESIKLLRPVLPSSIELRFHSEEGLQRANVDPVQINQLVMNLCINARDAMDESGLIEIKVAMAKLDSQPCNSCHQRIDGDFIEVSVKDNGPGISSEAQKRIFEPFFTTKEVGKGTGMGLSMVHGIMHHFGGHIMVNSEPGVGVEFRLLFPAVEASSSGADAVHDVDDVDFRGKGETILVVDDEEVIALFIHELLKGKGYKVVHFDDSAAALEYFKAHQQGVDLVITDQTMPGLTGIEMAEAMLGLRADLPIILATGYSALVDEEKSRSKKIGAFLHKPFDTRKLLATVDALLNG